MAQKTTIELIDDIDGSDASETVRFGLDGVDYEIDLSEDHAAQLRESMGTWVGQGRRAEISARRRSSSTTPRPSRSSDLAKVRQWARDNGYEVSDRGRVSTKVMSAYESAQP